MKPEEIKTLNSLHELLEEMTLAEMTMAKAFAAGMAAQKVLTEEKKAG